MQNRFVSIFLAISFVLGLGMCAMGAYTLFFEKRGYVQTTAVIDHIDEIWTGVNDDGGDEYSYDVYVNYTVDGVDYQTLSDFYQVGYEAGKEVKIFYNPADPTDIHGDSAVFGMVWMIAGPLVSIGCLVRLLRSRRTA